jgi:hypothetical protein
MNNIIAKIVITRTTIVFAAISVAGIIIGYYVSFEFNKILSGLAQNKEISDQEFNQIKTMVTRYLQWIGIPLMLVSWFLPLFWAWQNYKVFKTKWLYIVAVTPIFFNLQGLVALMVFLVLCLSMFWKEFDNWRIDKTKSS